MRTLALCLAAMLALAGAIAAQTTATTMYYGDVTLPSPSAATTFFGTWNVKACNLSLKYKINLNGVVSPAPWDTSWTGVGVADSSGPRGWVSSGAPGFLTHPNNTTQNIVDKHNLGAAPARFDESSYDATGPDTLVTAPIGNPWSNYGIWFDRDGVDQWQAGYWGSKNGATYNTGGSYDVSVIFHSVSGSATQGTMFNTINGVQTGFYDSGWMNAQPQNYPVGKSFTGDLTQLSVYTNTWAPSASYGTVTITDLTATGCLNLDEGMATGGGWFIPESDKATGLVNLGYKATFGFVAKNKLGGASGQLEFQYHGDDLNLKSTAYDWVTVSANSAMFEGVGTINDAGAYKFRVRAVDGALTGGAPDRFEIRIWTGGGSFDSPVYRAEGNLGGGQIVVKK